MPDETLLLYTRRYLAPSYLLAPQPITHCRLLPLSPITDIRNPFTFSSCEDIDVYDPNTLNCPEKLILEHETAIYLSSILTAPDDDGYKLLCEDLSWSKSRRIEKPLVKEIKGKKVHRVKQEVLKEIPLRMGGDVGIEWDRDVRSQVWEYVRDSEVEKMSIGPAVLQFLQEVHRPGTPPSIMELVLETSGFLTPPLLPSSPTTSPLSLRLAETLDLKPINGGRASSLIGDLTADFLAADSMLIDPTTDFIPSPLEFSPPTPSPIRKRRLPETLAVEALLTPPASTHKRVRFSDLVLPPRIATPEQEDNESESEGKQLLARVGQELAQEQLQEADSTLRIKVPVMDFSRPKPPWEEVGNELDRLHDLKWAGLAARKWSGSGSVGMELSWRPFVRNAVRVPAEEMQGEELISALVVRSDAGTEDERSLVENLRTLGLEESEDDSAELGPGVFTVKMDIEALAKRKRKRKTVKPKEHIQTAVDEDTGGKIGGAQRDKRLLDSSPLDTFMALRSRVPPKKPENTLHPLADQTPGLDPVPTIPDTTDAPQPPLFPVPKIHLPAFPGAFIVSTTLLSKRLLFRAIRDLYPTATIIERDFTIPIPDTFTDIPSNPNPDPEADLLLSPLSGVVLTTLQNIRQAPLPGHVLSTIRQRVADIAFLYERLFILVLGTVRGSDVETITGFMSFAAGLRSGVHVRVIPEDGDVAAKWIVALMVREGSPVRLLEEETLWERFLRRAGLNAFAAQVVLRERRDGGLRALLKMGQQERKGLLVGVAGRRVGIRVEGRLGGGWEG